MAYAKLFSTITESSLWSASKDARLLFMSMLAKADQVGYVEAALPGLARIANLTLAETEAALAELMAPDPYSKSPDCDGARVVKVDRGWCLVNYETYRERQDGEQRRDYMREYMRNRRKAPGKSLQDETQPNEESNTSDVCKQSVNSVSVGKRQLGQAEADAKANTEGERERPPAVNLTEGKGETLEEYLRGQGCRLTKDGTDLMPEWRKVTKGLRASMVMRIMDEAKPGIMWPSEFKAHRAQRAV